MPKALRKRNTTRLSSRRSAVWSAALLGLWAAICAPVWPAAQTATAGRQADSWVLRRGQTELARGPALAPEWRGIQVAIETITLDRQSRCRMNAATVYEGTDRGEQVSNEGTVLIRTAGSAVDLLALEEDFIEPVAQPPAPKADTLKRGL